MSFKPIEERRIGRVERNGVVVSTVELPDYGQFDDEFWEEEPVYETLVFGGEYDDESMSYMAYEDAVAGHAAMVEKVFGPLTAATSSAPPHPLQPSPAPQP